MVISKRLRPTFFTVFLMLGKVSKRFLPIVTGCKILPFWFSVTLEPSCGGWKDKNTSYGPEDFSGYSAWVVASCETPLALLPKQFAFGFGCWDETSVPWISHRSSKELAADINYSSSIPLSEVSDSSDS